ncbi:MAG: hypothetical protein ACP5QT_02675 [Brevinematia bacterium]
MRKFFLLIFLILFSLSAYSKESNFGIGLIAGEPTGISMKYWIDKNSGIDIALAWSFEREASFRVHIDYLWHFREVFKGEFKDFYPYVGGGALVNISERFRAGIRVPVGAGYLFRSINLEVFLEVVPVVNVFPATTLAGNAGIGVRYYF